MEKILPAKTYMLSADDIKIILSTRSFGTRFSSFTEIVSGSIVAYEEILRSDNTITARKLVDLGKSDT